MSNVEISTTNNTTSTDLNSTLSPTMLISSNPPPTNTRSSSPAPSIFSTAPFGSFSSSSSRSGSQSPAPVREPPATRIMPKEEVVELFRAIQDSEHAKMMSLLAGKDSAVAEKVAESWEAIRAEANEGFESSWAAVPEGFQGDAEARDPAERLVTEEQAKRWMLLMEEQTDALVERLRKILEEFDAGKL